MANTSAVADGFGNFTVPGNLQVGGTVALSGALTTGPGGQNAFPLGTIAPRHINAGGTSAVLAADGNNSTPVTTECYISEIFVPYNMTATGVGLFNGSDVTGNVQVSLADATGAPIAAALSASTAGSGTDAYQLIPFAAPYAMIGPAKYFIMVQYSSATARYNTFAVGKHAVTKQTGGTYGTFVAFTPPTTFTTAIGNICGLY